MATSAGGLAALLLAAGAAFFIQANGDDTVGGRGGKAGPTATQYGAAFQTDPGESYSAGLARTDQTLGKLDVVRVFYPRAPQPWPGRAPGRDVVVSFKLDPKLVVAGRFDDQMKQWFADAPKKHDVYWTYWHEPEDDVEAGTFTAAQYKAAFGHLDELADRAKNQRLRSTVILQSYTTRPASGRDWRDFVPDPKSVDVLAWDVYNRVRDGGYASPEDLLGAAASASASIDRPFAVAELGSALAPGDDGSARGAWLTAMGQFCEQHDAVFVTYFDFSWNGGADDYRLRDAASVRAWKDISGS